MKPMHILCHHPLEYTSFSRSPLGTHTTKHTTTQGEASWCCKRRRSLSNQRATSRPLQSHKADLLKQIQQHIWFKSLTSLHLYISIKYSSELLNKSSQTQK